MAADTTDRRRLLAGLAVAMAPLALAGCPLQGITQRPPPRLFILTPKSTFPPNLPKVPWQLVVEQPYANAGIDNFRIALMRRPQEVEYYANANWTTRMSSMVQTLMIESFENSNAIVAVGRQAIGLRADYQLASDIREFQAEYFNGPQPDVRVALNLRLIYTPTRTIVGNATFQDRTVAAQDEIEAIISAFDEALGKVLRRMVEWTLETGQADYLSRHRS